MLLKEDKLFKITDKNIVTELNLEDGELLVSSISTSAGIKVEGLEDNKKLLNG